MVWWYTLFKQPKIPRKGRIIMLELKNRKLAPVLLFMSALLWSTSGIFTKSVAWSGMSLAVLKGVIAFFFFLLYTRAKRIRITPKKLLAAFCYFVQGALFMLANKLTTAANATVLENTSPLWIILFGAVLCHNRPTRLELTTCLCLFLGVTLAFAGNMGGGSWMGNIVALVSAAFYAGVFFLSKDDSVDSIETLVLGNAMYLPLIPLLLTDPAVPGTPAGQWAFVLIFALLSGVGAWLCFAVGIRHTSALQANFITMTEPIMAPLWTFLLLGETLTPLSLTGCAIVIGTLLWYHVRSAKQA